MEVINWKKLVLTSNPVYVSHDSTNGKLQSLILKVQEKKEDNKTHEAKQYALKVYPNHPGQRNPALAIDPKFLIDVNVMKKFAGHPNVVHCFSAQLGREIFVYLNECIVAKILQLFYPPSSIRRQHYVPVNVQCMGFSLMELSQEGDLSDFLSKEKKREQRVSFAQRLKFAQDIVSGLATFHASNYVLQDLKLSNLLLFGKSDTIKFCDFEECANVAKMGWKYCRGTSGYIAPERLISSFPLDVSSDIWSLGIVLFKLFCCSGIEKGIENKPFLSRKSDLKSNLKSNFSSASCSDRLHSSDSDEKEDLYELVNCFRFVPFQVREAMWSQWTQKYYPIYAQKQDGDTKNLLASAMINHKIQISKRWQHETSPFVQTIRLVIQACLQVDPMCRPKIQEIQQMLLCPIYSSPIKETGVMNMDNKLESREKFLSFLYSQLAPCFQPILSPTDQIRVENLLLYSCPELHLMSLKKTNMIEQILHLAKRILFRYATCNTLFLSKPVPRKNQTSPFSSIMVSASIWIAIHAYLDMVEFVEKFSSTWTTWGQQVLPEVMAILQVLDWNCFQ